MRRPHSAADRPRRRRCEAMLLALKRALGETESAAGGDDFPARPTRRSWRSSSNTRRFRAAISERWVVEAFFREEVSRRISLREIRDISSFRTDATFDIDVGYYMDCLL